VLHAKDREYGVAPTRKLQSPTPWQVIPERPFLVNLNAYPTSRVYINEYSDAPSEEPYLSLRSYSELHLSSAKMATAETLRANAALLSYDQVPETKYERM
jgi:hypothetical protein